MRPPDRIITLTGRRRPVVRASWFGLVANVAVVSLFGWSFADFVSRIDDVEALPAHHAEGAVALTGGADRIADAIDLLAAGRVDRLLITGVNPMNSRAELARKQKGSDALFECCIELGYEAANTVGNATETERWARAHRIRSLVVVTSNYHMPRALAEIGSALPDVDLLAYPVVSDRSRGHDWWLDPQGTRLVLFEYCKYIASQVRLRLHLHPADAAQEASVPAGAAGPVVR